MNMPKKPCTIENELELKIQCVLHTKLFHGKKTSNRTVMTFIYLFVILGVAKLNHYGSSYK